MQKAGGIDDFGTGSDEVEVLRVHLHVIRCTFIHLLFSCIRNDFRLIFENKIALDLHVPDWTKYQDEKIL